MDCGIPTREDDGGHRRGRAERARGIPTREDDGLSDSAETGSPVWGPYARGRRVVEHPTCFGPVVGPLRARTTERSKNGLRQLVSGVPTREDDGQMPDRNNPPISASPSARTTV